MKENQMLKPKSVIRLQSAYTLVSKRLARCRRKRISRPKCMKKYGLIQVYTF